MGTKQVFQEGDRVRVTQQLLISKSIQVGSIGTVDDVYDGALHVTFCMRDIVNDANQFPDSDGMIPQVISTAEVELYSTFEYEDEGVI